jgi:hypothetical protein
MAKINPFAPNSLVNPGMFVGRLKEVQRLETCLFQTQANQPTNFMITGERGIGKSSLLSYLRWEAEGTITSEDRNFKFLVVDTDIDVNTTQSGLLEKIRLGIDAALAKTEATRSFLKETWGFLQRVEVASVKLKPAEKHESEELLAERFSYTLAEISNRLTNLDSLFFGSQYDGILILIDEADNASPNLGLGSFLKLLSERLQKRGCRRVVFGLAGLPPLRDVLFESHPSSLRLFDEVELGTLSNDEVGRVIDRCMAKANEINTETTAIADAAKALLIFLSEGYPHFIQQFGYSAFNKHTNNVITDDDVSNGAFSKGGALDLIGDRYYRNNFYNKIQSENYRKVLRIMANSGIEWVKKATIQKEFKGKDTILNNAIKVLIDRNIIIPKEGARGTYRLQQRGFAWWINLRATDHSSIQNAIESSPIKQN